MKLSLCLAVYNEAKNIHYPLDSAYGLADEVVIVDGGSTDKTVEIAKSYGNKVRVIQSDNPKMFHKNKQKAIQAAKGEWILQLDADEELSDQLRKEITNVILGNDDPDTVGRGATPESTPDSSSSKLSPRQNPVPVAYWLPRKNWFLTRFLMKGGQYPDYTIRLYRNGYAKFPCKDVHENVEIVKNLESRIQNSESKETNEKNINSKFNSEFYIHNSKLKIGFLKNPILHYADPDFSRYLMRWDRYTSLEVEKMLKEDSTYHLSPISYLVWKPLATFFFMYFRHKGFMDGFPGFVFALFSSIRYWVIYIKWWQKIT